MDIGNSIVGPNRLKTMQDLAFDEAIKLNGIIAEVGVYKGGSAKVLAKLFHDRRVLLFDTFSGIPVEKMEDNDSPSLGGRFADTSLESVQEYLKECPNCEFYPGLFPESLGKLATQELEFAVVHVDCDLYRTVLDCCEFFYPRMVEGGLVFFDDFSWVRGARIAILEFFGDKPEELIRPDFNTTGGTCFIRKGG